MTGSCCFQNLLSYIVKRQYLIISKNGNRHKRQEENTDPIFKCRCCKNY